MKHLVPNELLTIRPLNRLRYETCSRIPRLMIQDRIQNLITEESESIRKLGISTLRSQLISQYMIRYYKSERGVIAPSNSTLRRTEERGLIEAPHIVQKRRNDKERATRVQILLKRNPKPSDRILYQHVSSVMPRMPQTDVSGNELQGAVSDSLTFCAPLRTFEPSVYQSLMV
jgi:hypothetical protein